MKSVSLHQGNHSTQFFKLLKSSLLSTVNVPVKQNKNNVTSRSIRFVQKTMLKNSRTMSRSCKYIDFSTVTMMQFSVCYPVCYEYPVLGLDQAWVPKRKTETSQRDLHRDRRAEYQTFWLTQSYISSSADQLSTTSINHKPINTT